MSGIDRVGATPPSRAMTGGHAAASSGFVPLPETSDEAPYAEALSQAGPVALDGMLALQQVDGESPDRTARRHGQGLLAALGRLQACLLAGGDLAGILDELGSLADGMPPAADPRLRAALDHVVLRARIELARHGG